MTNSYLPLVPGTTLLYRGVMKDGTTPQVDNFTVTHRRKVVMGVICTVVREHGHFGKMIDSGPAGVNGAQPGVMMEAHPTKGDSYWQFHWPGHALDTAIVLGSGGSVDLPYRTFKHTLLTQEQSPLEPGVRDLKWSVRGIGYVEERAASGTKEQIKLVRVTHH